jgi:hypothetical protein
MLPRSDCYVRPARCDDQRMQTPVCLGGREPKHVLLMEFLNHRGKCLGQAFSGSSIHVTSARVFRDLSKRCIWRSHNGFTPLNVATTYTYGIDRDVRLWT